MSIILAVDGMGGDQAPAVIIDGMARAVHRFPHVRFKLFGSQELIEPLLESHKALAAVTEFTPTTEVVTADTKPGAALRHLKDSSLRRAIQAVKEGSAHGIVSAGNTGAYMALSRLLLGTIPGIDRPAISGLMPTPWGPKVMLDMGANVDVTADNLVEFAIMGVAFARVVLGIADPSIGLLNIGSEELKGNVVLKTAYQKLKESTTITHFKGFVEADSFGHQPVDVTVADGFVGNICIKAAEGTSKLITHFLKEGIEKSWLSKIGVLMARPAFKYLRDKIDPRRYNGAPFLGLQGVAVKSHGGTDAEGFLQALQVAIHMIEKNITQNIAREISAFSTNSQLSKSSQSALPPQDL